MKDCDKSIEYVVNSMVFGIPSPPRQWDILKETENIKRTPERPLVQLRLSPDPRDFVHFKHENPFDVHIQNYENIWSLI